MSNMVMSLNTCPSCTTNMESTISGGSYCISCGFETPPEDVRELVVFKKQYQAAMKNPYAPCYCGSGKKFKFCCRNKH